MLGESLGDAEAAHGGTRFRESITQRPAEAAVHDAVLDRDHGVVVGGHVRQIGRNGDEPAGVHDGDADAVCGQSSPRLNGVGRACSGSHDQYFGG